MVGRSFLLAGIVSLLFVTWGQAQSRKLQPSKEYKKYWAEFDGPARTYRVPLFKRHKLVAVGDTLYMLNGNRVEWNWTAHIPFTDAPILDTEGTIYVIGYDLLWAALDARTGREEWRGTANGRATYSQMKPYLDNMYFVVTDMWGYRDSLRDQNIQDKLRLCRRNGVLWETSIPANARLEVSGNKVFVSYRHNKHLVRRRISIPQHFAKPIFRISMFADSDGRQIIDAR